MQDLLCTGDGSVQAISTIPRAHGTKSQAATKSKRGRHSIKEVNFENRYNRPEAPIEKVGQKNEFVGHVM